jgi:hypothetical protein
MEQAMGQAIAITNRAHSATELRHLAARQKEAALVRRMLALALILEGHSRTAAARQNGMDRQTLCDWVHRYNAQGVAGLASRLPPSATPRLDERQRAELEALVLAGPDPATDGVVRWRCVDLRAGAAALCGHGARTHHRQMAAPAQADPAATASRPSEAGLGGASGVQANFASLSQAALPGSARGKPIEVWFQML